MSDVLTRFLRDGNTFACERVQDVEPYLEWNAIMRSTEQKSDWGREIAEIPNVILERWFNDEYERGNVSLRMYTKEFGEIVKRKLKDPDWAWLRTDAKFNGMLGFGS